MVRRGSTSSYTQGTSANRPPFGALQRSPSSGSMSERTFRTQSPGASRSASPVHPVDVPPVPSIPASVSSIANSSEKRANNPRAPSNRASTIAPNNLRPLDTATAANEARARAARPASALANPSSPQAESPRLINFSRPMSPQMNGSAAHQRVPSSSLSARGAARPASSLGFTQQNRAQNNRNVSQSSTSNAAVTAALSAALPAGNRGQQNLPSRPSSSMSTTRSKSPTNGPPGMVWVPMDEAIRRGLVPSSTNSQPQRPASAMATTRATSPPAVRNAPPVPKIPESAQVAAGQYTATNPPPRARPTSALSNNRAPSDEQIRVFQTRAAALLARPRSDAAAAAAAESNRSVQQAQPIASRPPPVTQYLNQTHSRSASQPVSQLAPPTARVGRSTSISPSRSAHFSSSPIVSAVKHEPLPRAASPFKSALKTHSSRPTSPVGSHNVAQSDTSSLRSEEGSIASAKKRKQVRVSFDATPLSVGEATTPVSPINTIASPQNVQMPSFTGSSLEPDHGMGFRPALPTFGSVRSRKGPSEEETDAVHDTTAPSIAVQPATPAVEEVAKFERPSTPPQQQQHVRTQSLEDALSAENVQHVSQSSPKQLKFDVTRETQATHPVQSTTSAAVATPSAIVAETPSHIVAEPVTGPSSSVATTSLAEPSQPSSVQNTLASLRQSEDAAEESDEAPDQFADATEVPDEDGQPAGYASLDAILEDAPESQQPTALPPATEALMEPTASVVPTESDPIPHIPSTLLPGAALSTIDPSGSASEQNWETVRAYWSSLSTSQRQQLEAEALPLPEDESFVGAAADTASSAAVPKTKPVRATDNLPPWPDKMYRSSMTATPTEAASSNAKQPKANSDPVLARGTLRGTPETNVTTPRKERTPVNAMSKTLREKSQPTSAPSSNVSAEAAALARSIDPKSVLKKPLLSRRGSSDSIGSDSSYKRSKRRGSSNDTSSQYTMKRSMRGAAPRTQVAETPTDTRARRTTMRHSVRDSIDSTMSTDKGRDSRLSFLGAGKFKTSKGASKKSGTGGSRFADSSDEEDGPPQIGGFRSRFNDSDDEDDGLGALDLSPVRKLPRAAGQHEGDSTDLSDDSDAEQRVSSSAGRTATVNGKSHGSALGSGTLRNHDNVQEKTKSGTFSFGRRKKTDAPGSPSSAISSTERPESRMSRTMREPGSTKRSSSRSSFLRRLSFSQPNSPRREDGGRDFPFEAPPIPNIPDRFKQGQEPADARPFTADGVSSGGAPSRPPLGGKRISTMTAPDVNNENNHVIVSSRTGKKKRFQGLRRALRLD